MNSENEHTSIREDVMRSVCLRSMPLAFIFPLAFILLAGCAKHDLRCDTHLTAINPPEPLAAAADPKPAGRGSP
jgi:hypothetical protein